MTESILSYRPRLSDDGRLMVRQLSRNEITICVTNMLSHEEALLVRAPARLREALEDLFAGLRALQGRLYAPAPTTAPEALAAAPEALLHLGTQQELLSLRWVNNELDRLIADLAALLTVLGRRASSPQRREAAQGLSALWFGEGRGFLTLESQLQWAETARRFDALPEEVKADLALLDLQGQVDDIVALNGWFARLLGVSPDTTPTTPALAAQAPLEDEIAAVFARALCLANVLWPGKGAEDVNARRLLLGTWLDFVAPPRLR